jgi:hypothetical protein
MSLLTEREWHYRDENGSDGHEGAEIDYSRD